MCRPASLTPIGDDIGCQGFPVASRDHHEYLRLMLRLARMCLVMLAVFGLALAGPVQVNCALPEAAAAAPCADMTMDEGSPEQQQPSAPMKACAIVQCPSAPPAVAEVAAGVGEPVLHAARLVMSPVQAMASADLAPEQRPPIS